MWLSYFDNPETLADFNQRIEKIESNPNIEHSILAPIDDYAMRFWTYYTKTWIEKQLAKLKEEEHQSNVENIVCSMNKYNLAKDIIRKKVSEDPFYEKTFPGFKWIRG